MSNDKTSRQIIIQLDPTVDFKFKLGNFISFDESRVPSVCDEKFEKYVIHEWRPEDIVRDLSEDEWYFYSIEFIGEKNSGLMMNPFKPVADADALFIVNREALDQIPCGTKFLFSEIDEYADFLDTVNWEVFLYEDDEPVGRNDMCYTGELEEILPKLKEDLPADFKALIDSGEYEVRPF